MALQEMNFEYKVESPKTIENEWIHSGVVGSGDLEILMERKNLDGGVKVKVVSPVSGFDHVWNKVINKFVNQNQLGDVSIEINDNNATPVVVALRLSQALLEANKKEQEVG